MFSDYSAGGQYPPGVNNSSASYHTDPNYANFNPYAQEFMLSDQDRHNYDQVISRNINKIKKWNQK